MKQSVLVVALPHDVGFRRLRRKTQARGSSSSSGRPATPPPAPPPTTQAAPAPVVDEYNRLKAMPSDEIDRMGLLGEIHFDLDKADLRESDRAVLSKNAEVLKKFDFLR